MTETELKQLAGGVVMVGFRGTEAGADSSIARQIRELHLAGVILFRQDAVTGDDFRNIRSPQQLAALTAQLCDVRKDLLVSIDQEGGQVSRLGAFNGHADQPSHHALGTHNDIGHTRRVAGDIAAACSAGGIHINFAPCVDVNVYPQNPIVGQLERSFSSDAACVSEHAAAFVDGHFAQGVLPALKHFPGHGSSREDTHFQPVDITETHDDCELQPYRAILAHCSAQGHPAPLVMVGHLTHCGWDPRHPATLSRHIIGDILRGQLGFDGVIVTDCLDMDAISNHYTLSEVVIEALNAGVDLLLFGNNCPRYAEDRAERVVEAIMDAVRDGAVSEACLRAHAERVQSLQGARHR